jgi:hypothetical protein
MFDTASTLANCPTADLNGARNRWTMFNSSRAARRRIGSWAILLAAAVLFGVIAGHGVFGSGYILQIDMTWGPHAPPVQSGFFLPIELVQHAAVSAFGGATVGKAYVLGVLTLCAFAPMVALRKQPLWIAVLCGGLGVFNPWVYERIVDGQWDVAAAAASLFLWLAAFEYLETRPGWTGAILVALCTDLVIVFYPGFAAMLVILVGAWFIFRDRPGRRSGDRPASPRDRHRWMLRALLLAVIPLLFGAIQFVFGRGNESYQRVQNFAAADLKLFRAEGLPYGLPVRLIGLSGFWAERTGRFEHLDAGVPWWPIAALALAGLVFAGAWRNRERVWLLVAGVVGLAISASTAIPPIRTMLSDVGRRIPLVFSFREPEKFSALWLVATVMLVGYLLTSLVDDEATGHSWRAPVTAVTVVALVLLLGAGREPGLLARTLRPATFPASWYATSSFLKQHPVDTRTAVLPWHHYFALPFADNRPVQDPADLFFPGDLLVAQDRETSSGVASDPDADIAAAAIAPGRQGCRLASALRAHAVGQVIVLPFLEGPTDLEDLLRCGFHLVHGGATTVAVVRDARHV